jgi:hypothetical protein
MYYLIYRDLFRDSLSVLTLWENSISDISPLLQNEGLGAGDFIDLKSNPLSTHSEEFVIPALLGRAVSVSWDLEPEVSPGPSPLITPLTTPADSTPTAVPTETPPAEETGETPFNVWVIIGPVIGVSVVAGAVYFLRRR